jgi:Tfp pilus assembly protein PilV
VAAGIIQKYQVAGRIFNMTPNRLTLSSGQGLIETLIIILFVGVSVVAMITFQHKLNYSTSFARQQNDAAIATLNEIETLRDYSVLNTTAGYVAYSNIASGAAATTINNTTYTSTWTITTVASPAYKTIDVTTTWNDYYGASQSIRIITNVAGTDPSTASTFM